MSSMLDVYVYGNGDLFRECFNAIATTMSAGEFSSVIKFSVLFAGVWCIFGYIQTKSLMVFVKWTLVYLFVMDALFLPTKSINIQDQTYDGAGPAYEVDNVPAGIAILASITTSIGVDLTNLLDETFTPPDYMPYSQTGLVMASRLVKAASQFQVTDPTFSGNLQQFIQGCVNYDVMLGKYTIKDLMSQENIWQFVSEHASPANAFIYNSVVTTCKDGAAALSADWSTQITDAETQYGARLYPALEESAAKAEFQKRLASSYSFLMNLSKSTEELVQQNIMANMMQQGIVNMGAGVNTSAALIAYSDACAEEHIRLQMQTLGSIAADWLPLIRNVLEVILLGCFVFVIPIALMPIGFSIVKNYALTLLWLQLWDPLFAIVNLAANFYAKDSSGSTGTSLTLVNYSGMALVNSDVISIAGYCSLLVPALAYGVLVGFKQSMMSMTQYLGGVLSSSTSSAVGESASGNFSLGNTNLNTHNQNLLSANHIETAGRIMTGGIMRSMSSGATQTINQDGSIVMDTSGAMSKLGVSINLAQSVHASATQQSEDALNHSQSSARASVSEYSNAIKKLYEYADSKQHSDAINNSDTATKSNSFTLAASKVHDAVDAYAKEHQVSKVDAERSVASNYFEEQLSGKIDSNKSFIGKVAKYVTGASGSLSGSYRHGNDFSNSHEQATNDNTSNSFRSENRSSISETLDSALRYAHDRSHQMNDDSTQRATDSFSKSMDHANSLRNESIEQFQKK
ncbi:MAG: conjugal transfer protein TraG N-terminal domain-containing protein [Gammaproteobacteria bacterium]|nr:conjugal transfer protein TraG N-terminal domain-containing protein [Gammaproteobacteria bacterium]